MMKFWVVLPAETVTEGRVTLPVTSGAPTALLVMVIGTPPAGATPVSVIFNVAELPPRTLFGVIVIVKSTGVIVRTRLIGAPPRVALIVGVIVASTTPVWIVNVREVAFGFTRI